MNFSGVISWLTSTQSGIEALIAIVIGIAALGFSVPLVFKIFGDFKDGNYTQAFIKIAAIVCIWIVYIIYSAGKFSQFANVLGGSSLLGV
jgi:hypothetical protein